MGRRELAAPSFFYVGSIVLGGEVFEIYPLFPLPSQTVLFGMGKDTIYPPLYRGEERGIARERNGDDYHDGK